MALYDLRFSIPSDAIDAIALEEAVSSLGYVATVKAEAADSIDVLVEHKNANYDFGSVIAADILKVFPDGSRLISYRQAIAVSEITDKECEMILASQMTPH